MNTKALENNNNIIIYTSDDGQVKIEVRLEDENVWLTQNAMAELFDTTRNNITMHIKNIFEEGELQENSVSKESLLTAKDGKNYKTKFYNLDLIISVGYRVKSIRGTQFRIWANKLIKEYLIKGYNLNVDRFKNNAGGVYFEEVLEKIRDIRSSEKVFWRKILDIYATSVDYDARDEKTKEFFKTVQNKMHYAVHRNTAAEVIFNRVDSEKDNIGLTNFKGNSPTRAETEIAKNYLSEKELDLLNRMVSAYLDVAEINALNMHPMTMKDWIKELDGFLTMTHKDILNGAGKISRAVIEIAKVFNMKIYCNTLNPEKHKDLLEQGVEFLELDTLLSNSDIIIVNIPLNEENNNLISKDKIRLMKKSATFINTSRAEIVDMSELMKYADENETFNVGLDIDAENYKEILNVKRNNVIVTPHIAGVTKEAIKRMDVELAIG